MGVRPLRGRIPFVDKAVESLEGPEGRLDRRALGAVGVVLVPNGPFDGLHWRRVRAAVLVVWPDALGQAQGRHEERALGRGRVRQMVDAESQVLDGNGGEEEDARKVAGGCDREAVGEWPPEIGRIALQKIDDLKAEGVEGIGVVGHPPDDLPGPLAPPRFLWKEESRLMAPPPSCSGMA